MSEKTKVNVFWFRRDLRLEDNHALFQALSGKLPVLPIFIFDTGILDKLTDTYDRRVDFIHQRLQEIDKTFKKSGRNLHVFHGKPQTIFRDLINKFNIGSVFINRDYEPAALLRDRAVEDLLAQSNIHFESFKDQVVLEKDEVLKADGTPYTVYTPYRKIWEQQLSSDHIAHYPSENHLNKLSNYSAPPHITLTQLGFEKTNITFNSPQINEEIIRLYEQQRDIPSIQGTSRLSVHLRFGTVSIRQLVRIALQLNDTWLSELIWRDFFSMILYQFPEVVHSPFRKKYTNMKWMVDPAGLEHWQLGQTGYPLVDAGMRELNATGFMHNRVRMLTAGFLTKHLLINWQEGERYFAGKLLDYDLASNNGNWQWAAGCGCDAAPYFRIFNPTTQAKKFDPIQKYIRQWIPELDTQKYPKPIIEHSFARQRALDRFKNL